MTLPTQPYKGARDFYPEDKQKQDYLFNTIRRVVKRYGYAEYDAPILEPLELYKAKSGEEIVNEQTYTFADRGGREVAIRPEMTPTVSRMVAARRQELAYPLRWFSIPNLWRYERPQRGRLREHWQLNVDIFGEAGLAADHEIIMIANNILKEFGATPRMYQIKINSRQLMDELLRDYLGLNPDKMHALSKLIDRMNKMDEDKFIAAVTGLCIGEAPWIQQNIITLLETKSLDDLPDEYKNTESAKRLRRLLELLGQAGITNAVYDIKLMRGFDYYSDIVFEVFDIDPENNRSMFGGGRYDGLVALFGVDAVPTVGFGMGDVTLANFLESHQLLPEFKNEIDVLIVLIGDVYSEATKLAERLRDMELNVSIDSTDRKLEKKLKNADKQGIRYVLFVGENELKEEVYPFKDLLLGTEEKHSAERIATIIEDYRNR